MIRRVQPSTLAWHAQLTPPAVSGAETEGARRRYEAIKERFVERFGQAPEIYARSPGGWGWLRRAEARAAGPGVAQPSGSPAGAQRAGGRLRVPSPCPALLALPGALEPAPVWPLRLQAGST